MRTTPSDTGSEMNPRLYAGRSIEDRTIACPSMVSPRVTDHRRITVSRFDAKPIVGDTTIESATYTLQYRSVLLLSDVRPAPSMTPERAV